MSRDELLQALRRLAPETGSLACLGCGHEHRCSTHGCAIIKAAAALIEQMLIGDAVRKQSQWIKERAATLSKGGDAL